MNAVVKIMKNSEIRVNDYKYELALHKPWYISKQGFVKRIRKFIDHLPNWSIKWRGNYIILCLYFDDKGWDKDNELSTYEHQLEGNTLHLIQHDNSIITSIWI